jgi:signal peptidase II
MNKKGWLLTLAPLFLVFAVDQVTKMWAIEFTSYGPTWFEHLGIVMHQNHGAMLGMFSDLPPLLRVVSLTTSGACLVFVYAIIQFFLPENLMKLRVGLSILLGGILGNVTDRIVYGAVVDFIVLRFGDNLSPAFNLADALQWVGYALIVYMILFKGHLIWHEDNKRNKIWIDPKYQIKYSMILASVSLWFSIIFGVYSYTFMRVMINDFIINGTTNSARYLTPFLTILILLSCVFSITLFLIGRHLSHRSAGPVFGFRRYIKDLKEGKVYEFKLRAHDEFKQLEDVAEDYKELISELNEKKLKSS